ALTSQVEYTFDDTLRVADRHGRTGEDAEAVEEMFAIADHGRSALDQRGAQGIGTPLRLAPAHPGIQITQLAPLAAAALNGQHRSLGIHQDEQAVIAVMAEPVGQMLQGGL